MSEMPDEPATTPDKTLRPTAELERLKAAHFTPRDREERIARALRALEGPKLDFELPPELWATIAEDPDLEEH
jgi:hypothetical protein